MSLRNFLSAGAGALALGCALAPSAYAQQVTSGIRGTVTGPDGAPVVGVTVSAVNSQTGASRSVATNDRGAFNLQNLDTFGSWTVTVDSDEFADQTYEGVRLNVGGSTRLDVRLAELGEGLETIVVTGVRGGEVSRLAVGPSSVFDNELLNTAPTLDRDFRDILRLDPRVVVSPGGAISCNGANNRFNSLTIDGVRVPDLFGLNASGFPGREVPPIPFDAQGEVAVEFTPFDVKYGQFSGCNINIITKRGTNEFFGSASAFFNSASLTGRSLEGDTVQSENFRNFNWGAELGGAIIKDKLFFYAAYQETRQNGVENDGPAFLNFADPLEFVSEEDFNSFQQILEEVYGIDAGGAASTLPFETRRILTRWDWNITDNHRLSFTYQRNREEEVEPDDFFGDRLAFANSFEISGTEQEIYSARLFSQWTDNFSTSLRVSRNDVSDIQDPVGGGEAQSGDPIPRINVFVENDFNGDGVISGDENGFLFAGPGQFRSANQLDTQLDQIIFNADYQIGQHSLTFGYELDQLDAFNLFASNATGTFNFPSLAALEEGLVNNPDPFGEIEDDPSPSGADPLSLVGILGNGSFTGDINDAAASFSRSIHTLYIQDDWRITDRLNLLVGLRYDFYESSDAPIFNPIFEERYGFSNATGFDSFDVFLPRVAVTYDAPESLFGDTTFRAGAGVFSGGDPTVLFSNAFSNFGGAIGFGESVAGDCTAADLDVVDADGFTGLPQCIIDQQIAEATQNLGRVDATDPDFDVPSLIRGSVGFTHYTHFNGFAGGFFDDWEWRTDLIVGRTRNPALFVDLTLAQVGTAPDGRPIFNAIDPLRDGCDAVFLGVGRGFGASDPAQLANGGACDAGGDDQDILLTNDDRGATSISFSTLFRKNFEYNLPILEAPASIDFNLGYAFTEANVGNPVNSATATSSFEEVATFNFQDPPIADSQFANTHNISLNVNFRQEFVRDFPTIFSFVFQARSGENFSYVFDADSSVFAFGDSDFEARSLLYVPTGIDDPLVVFADGFDTEGFFDFLDRSGLSESAGGIAPRNAFNDPWFLDLDFSFQQEFPGALSGHRSIFFVTVENLPNLITDEANIFRTVDRGDVGEGVPIADVRINSNGQFVFSDFNEPEGATNVGASLWQVQFGFRYQF